MSKTRVLASVVAGALMAVTVHAAVDAAPREPDVQAPREREPEMQAPRGHDMQAPHGQVVTSR